ncbi:hypothetical protein B0H13DRAFT_2187818, partial [Mycena leptocephala]
MSLDPEQIDILLHLRDGTCRLILRRLYSLIAVSPIQTRFCIRHPIEVLHASFGDYLSDARRSRRWCISLPWLQADSLHCILHLLATPLLEDSQFYFYRDLLCQLPDWLRNLPPSEPLINLLRNPNFQKYLFTLPYTHNWPKLLIPKVVPLMHFSNNRRATFKYDSIYTEIFSQNPAILLVIQSQIVDSNLRYDLRCFGWTFQIFRPFLAFPELLQLGCPEGDSPVDLLADPSRAKHLYSEPCHIAEELVLRWICHAKRTLEGGFCELYPTFLGLVMQCLASSGVLRELETFNLSEFCYQMIIDPDAHRLFHRRIATE